MKLTIVDIEDRNVVKFDKRNDIFNNGADNAYPTLIERLINSSVTAISCAGVMAKFLYCKGFEFEYDLRLNKKFDRKKLAINKRGDTPNRLLRRACKKSVSKQKGVFFHINYNALYQKTSVDLIPYKYCRLGKEDSEGYKGKAIVYNNWDKTKKRNIAKVDFDIIDVFNPDPKVIQSQVENAGGWQNYKGQVYFLNLDENDTYPLAWIDTVQLDCDSEAQASIYKNRGLRKGFFGKYIFGRKPFESDEDAESFDGDIKGFVGAENSEHIMVVEVEQKGDKLEDELFIKPIERNSEDGFFAHTETTSANNIRKAYGNIPPVLIDYIQGKMGGTSGEEFVQAQLFYQNQLEEVRNDIEDVFEELFTNFHKPISNDWSIKPLVENASDN